jgi:hypothetical protein
VSALFKPPRAHPATRPIPVRRGRCGANPRLRHRVELYSPGPVTHSPLPGTAECLGSADSSG